MFVEFVHLFKLRENLTFRVEDLCLYVVELKHEKSNCKSANEDGGDR